MYIYSSIENGWADLAQISFQLFVIARTRFLRKKILGKPPEKSGNWKNRKWYT